MGTTTRGAKRRARDGAGARADAPTSATSDIVDVAEARARVVARGVRSVKAR